MLLLSLCYFQNYLEDGVFRRQNYMQIVAQGMPKYFIATKPYLRRQSPQAPHPHPTPVMNKLHAYGSVDPSCEFIICRYLLQTCLKRLISLVFPLCYSV